MKKWEAVIFDMDGTLFDTETISMKAWKRVGEKLHLPTSDTFILSLIGRTRRISRLYSIHTCQRAGRRRKHAVFIRFIKRKKSSKTVYL